MKRAGIKKTPFSGQLGSGRSVYYKTQLTGVKGTSFRSDDRPSTLLSSVTCIFNIYVGFKGKGDENIGQLEYMALEKKMYYHQYFYVDSRLWSRLRFICTLFQNFNCSYNTNYCRTA